MSYCTMRLRSRINFGKYKNYFVKDVLVLNPSYLVWCIENTNTHPSVELVEELIKKGFRIHQIHGKRVVSDKRTK